ncbi:hypothetical protein B0A55_03010 [Friedmanniomyces simplex]|uniref:Xylanolytic transcriptional activator regulatory domain-containing protein n=1 Tax=Friedmanniomyces simplex TaxID=329884 RepID=A0A4U0Y0Q6_9PEZI|nr:hypothetical protein B0A55_03010 [Friedmanniomyces simplex]
MAVGKQVTSPVPAAMTKMNIGDIIHQTPRLLILYDRDQQDIVRIIADVLGQKYVVAETVEGAGGQPDSAVVGLDNSRIATPEDVRRIKRTVVTTHCIDLQDLRDEELAAVCEYEYLYTQKQYVRRDVARFMSFVLGQIKPHDDLKKKARTTLLSTTFPDIRAALPNLDIMSVGADSVELRVDLLQEPEAGQPKPAVPSIKYVGEQVMLLRQRTELPIIFTTRCTRENGRFPMEDPMLFYKYLRKAMQWGCEYIDVELWLPEEIRAQLAAEKGSSRIISAWHDFSGRFKWSSAEAQQLFKQGAIHGDIVKMIALVNTTEENYELEYFRSIIQTTFAHPPLSGLNMGPVGQLSRTLNKSFSPITHPLLPMIAAPGQLSAAEINSMLHSMGQMPKLDLYAIGNVRQNGQAMFFEKCLNELSLPHQLLCIERSSQGSIERYVSRPTFGGAHINPPLAATAPYLPRLSNAATAIGQIDTVVAHNTPGGKLLVGDNATWKGIRATLTREFVPSAYAGQAALVLASHEAQAAAAIYALTSLDIGPIYTIGFKARSSVAANIQQFRGIEDMKRIEQPFVVISALPGEKSFVVSPLLKHYSSSSTSGGVTKPALRLEKVFVDLSANGSRGKCEDGGKGDSVANAAALGWTAYGVADVNAWTTVETLRLLVGQNVPFVTMAAGSGDQFAMLSRPQIGIDRLPVRRPSNNEPKEAMNCKSCRKRKVGEHYGEDAIPKKRGPKTDVLEALLKRVNGLEKRLKDEKKSDAPEDAECVATSFAPAADETEGEGQEAVRPPPPMAVEVPQEHEQGRLLPAQPAVQPLEPTLFADALLDTYFTRVHGHPFYILDEAATRQRLRDGSLPRFLSNAIYAVVIRYASHLCGGHAAAMRYSQEYGMQSRAEIDVDEPSIEHLQALLLLAMANFQAGRGKKSYMLLTHAISMAFALSLHRELPQQLRIAPSEREGRRKLFWSCYLMDRFTVSGSRRPSLISDESICLRLPAWLPPGARMWMDGNYFSNGSSLPYAAGVASAGQGSGAMLVEIVRVLGVTNRYLAGGGVKGDSHFPWHAQSTLSRIRSDLDYWATTTHDSFTSLEALFGQPDSSTLVLSKLIYHLIHCLIYRPFLPVDLAELTGTGQHQSWQIEATNLCFLHANAIAELVDIGKGTSIIDWPSFVGYCICTAGIIHVHGAHYMSLREGDVFSHSAAFLSREMAQLHDLCFVWAGVQHQRETLQTVYTSHSQLVKSLATNPIRFSPVFQMEDFFDRYPGFYIDGAHVSFTDVDVDAMRDSLSAYNDGSLDVWMSQPAPEMQTPFQPAVPTQYMTQNQLPSSLARKPKRRRTTNGSVPFSNSMGGASSGLALDRRTSHEVQQQHHQVSYQEVPQQQHQQQQHQQQQHHQQQPPPLQLQNGEYDALPNEQAASNNHLQQTQTFSHSAFSPSFNFSPMPGPHTLSMPNPTPNPNGDNNNNTTTTTTTAHPTTALPNSSLPNGSLPNDQYYYCGGAGSGHHHPTTTMTFDHQTPSGFSQSAESAHTDPMDKDPFLSLLEQLAQNDGCLDLQLLGQQEEEEEEEEEEEGGVGGGLGFL